VYPLPEELRTAMRQRRQALGQSLREFLAEAIETELPGLRAVLREHLPAPGGVLRPARLPLTEPLLEALRSAGTEACLPAARLLLACLGRAARRKRRRRGTGPRGARAAAGQRLGSRSEPQAEPTPPAPPAPPAPTAGEEE
jgi:hypothetical protein